MTPTQAKPQQKNTWISIAIILASLGISYIPLPGVNKTVVVVSGTELQAPLESLESQFEQAHPQINLELKFQGSQDLVNNYIDQKNDFNPTVLIPANGQILDQLEQRWSGNGEAFYETPSAIAKTMLVGIAWTDRGQVLFPSGRFDWNRLENAMQQRNWGAIGGSSEWGSFDFMMTNPTRSNSGQLTLSLWAQSRTGESLSQGLRQPETESLFALAKRSVYLPPRSTDILLQEFITRGPNDADVATVYESIALHRWEQAQTTRNKSYQIYYLDPTMETVSTAGIMRRNVDQGTADAAKTFLDFLRQPEQQAIFIQYGFRPAISGIDLSSVPNSPWGHNIPGAAINPQNQVLSTPNSQELAEIQRLWQRVN
ncbi:MAG: substrate-binding domain-containing protein [Halothece sp. Uz-M2-17]|nr:substrate-binding domain-containing protein [Halothece sp. Uz-M2-17]